MKKYAESVYSQIEYAISGKLFVSDKGSWWQPIRIEDGNVVMLWGDCGNENCPEDLAIWTVDKWKSLVSESGTGLFKKVGMWKFAPVNDPASKCIIFAHRYPESAGRELYKLQEDKSKLLNALEAMIYIINDAQDGACDFNLYMQKKIKESVEKTLKEMK